MNKIKNQIEETKLTLNNIQSGTRTIYHDGKCSTLTKFAVYILYGFMYLYRINSTFIHRESCHQIYHL